MKCVWAIRHYDCLSIRKISVFVWRCISVQFLLFGVSLCNKNKQKSKIYNYLLFVLLSLPQRNQRLYECYAGRELWQYINKRRIKINLFTFSLVFIWISPCYFELIFQILICGSVFSVYAYLYKMINSRGGGCK